MPDRQQRADGFQCLASDRQRPNQLVLAKILGNVHLEDKLSPARKEIRGLPAVGSAWLDAVLASNRNAHVLAEIPIQVAEHQVVGPILLHFPALEDRLNVLARYVPNPRRLSANRMSAAQQDGDRRSRYQ